MEFTCVILVGMVQICTPAVLVICPQNNLQAQLQGVSNLITTPTKYTGRHIYSRSKSGARFHVKAKTCCWCLFPIRCQRAKEKIILLSYLSLHFRSDELSSSQSPLTAVESVLFCLCLGEPAGAGCPGGLWNLSAWGCSEFVWTWSWATSTRWPCLSRCLDQMTSKRPFQPQPFCNAVIKHATYV